MTEVKKSPKTKRSAQRGKLNMSSILIFIGLLLLVLSGWSWWHFVRNNPERVFNNMVSNTFRTGSVTRRVLQDSGTQKLDQVIYIQNRTQHTAHSFTNLSQNEGTGKTTVITESIGSPTVDYVRYTDIKTDQKDKDGKVLDFKDVLGIWGKGETQSEAAIGDLYGDSALGVFPFADLTSPQRKELLKIISDNNVYDVNYDTMKTSRENGRLYYNYTVKVQPSSYILMLKQFATDVGLTQLTNLDPKNYEQAQSLTFNVTVDVLSQRLAKISSVSGQRQEIFNSYGIFQDIDLPKDTIPLEQLQEKLQSSANASV